MSRKQSGSVAKFLLKWLVIPVGLAAIGFFVIGPRLGEQGLKSAPTPESQSAPAPTDEPATNRPSKLGEPEVEVTARPISRRRTPRRSTRRPTPPPEEAPTPGAPDESPSRDPDGG